MLEIISILGGTAGIISIVSFIMFFKQNKRLKNAEAELSESKVMNSEWINYEQQLDKADDRIEKRDEKIDKLEDEIEEVSQKNLDLIKQINELNLKIKLLEMCKCIKKDCTGRVLSKQISNE